MKQLDIKAKIDQNNELIEQLLTPNKFTLNNAIADLLLENENLQKQCNHIYEDGICVYCYKMEEDN